MGATTDSAKARGKWRLCSHPTVMVLLHPSFSAHWRLLPERGQVPSMRLHVPWNSIVASWLAHRHWQGPVLGSQRRSKAPR
mmetsp:Transcript_4935/g.12722  ORF Transcript_4935/g.12722 Transcript_4935/m.12722 type:complete len:81 (-) Transcript_4935:200-442(-)